MTVSFGVVFDVSHPASYWSSQARSHRRTTLFAEDRREQRPITVHSRGAERETVARLLQIDVTAVLHWYSDNLTVAEEAIDGGLCFSINPAMIKSQKAAESLRILPPSQVLLETDGPSA